MQNNGKDNSVRGNCTNKGIANGKLCVYGIRGRLLTQCSMKTSTRGAVRGEDRVRTWEPQTVNTHVWEATEGSYMG